MTRPIYASRLVATASKLAGSGSGAGRPALSDLRRATSTAYYALFHQIVRHSAFDFLPSAAESEVAEIARWYTHTGVFTAAALVMDAGSPAPLPGIRKTDRTSVMAIRSAGRNRVAADLITVADAFRTLQQARHSADCDGNYDPVRAVTINHVEDAEAALTATRSLSRAGLSPKANRRSDNAAYRTFLRLSLLKSGGPRSR